MSTAMAPSLSLGTPPVLLHRNSNSHPNLPRWRLQPPTHIVNSDNGGEKWRRNRIGICRYLYTVLLPVFCLARKPRHGLAVRFLPMDPQLEQGTYKNRQRL